MKALRLWFFQGVGFLTLDRAYMDDLLFKCLIQDWLELG